LKTSIHLSRSNGYRELGMYDGTDLSTKGRGSFRQGGHKPASAEFRRWGVGESTDEMIKEIR
jgi:hypothetical protein